MALLDVKVYPRPSLQVMQKNRLIPILFVGVMAFCARGATTTQFYAVTKAQRYAQTGDAAPVLMTSPQVPYRARTFVYSTAPSTTASVKTPGNVTHNLTAVAGDRLEYKADFNSFAAMTAAFANGSYTVTIISAADGTKNSVMTLNGDFFPTPIRVSNFSDAQSILVTQPFTLSWGNLGVSGNDLIHVRIEAAGATVFQSSPIPGATGALNGFSTGVTIPAGRLEQGVEYTCTVTLFRAIIRDTTTIPGAPGQTAYLAETVLPIRTRFNVLDVREYGIEKRVNHEQATAATPILRTNAFDMIGFAFGAAADSISVASVKLPAGSLRSLTAGGNDFAFVQSFPDAAGVNTAFPSGAYDFSITTKANGVRTNRITLPADAYPAIPQIVNIDEAQYLKHAAPITINWTSADANANDFAQFIVQEGLNTVYASPSVIGAAGALNGLNRSITLPANTLAPGKNYTGTIRVYRTTSRDTTTYAGSFGVGGFSRLTRFPMKTASGPSPKPKLVMPRRVGNQTELTFDSVRGEIYRIQSTQVFPSWSTIQTVTAAGQQITVLLNSSALNTSYYQVIAGL